MKSPIISVENIKAYELITHCTQINSKYISHSIKTLKISSIGVYTNDHLHFDQQKIYIKNL